MGQKKTNQNFKATATLKVNASEHQNPTTQDVTTPKSELVIISLQFGSRKQLKSFFTLTEKFNSEQFFDLCRLVFSDTKNKLQFLFPAKTNIPNSVPLKTKTFFSPSKYKNAIFSPPP